MDLPSLSDLNEFNRVLLAATHLSDSGARCKAKPIINLCSSFTLGGHAVDHYKTLQLCHHAGLLFMAKEIVKLTDLGKEFLSCNPEEFYEITGSQKGFIAEQLILSGSWQSQARDLLLSFSPNYTAVTYEISLDENPLPTRNNSIIHLLLALGVLRKIDNKLYVDPKYVSLIKWLRASHSGISEEELNQALQADMKLAHQAEEAALEYERERLRSINRDAEASLVRRISQLNIEAGYDIESFDGDKPLLDYDRFIEVKSSYRSELHFFWSENQRRVAEEKGDKYWIYFIGGLSTKETTQITPIMIQNPSVRLALLPNVTVKATTYLIEQTSEVFLTDFHQGKVRGFLL